MHSHFFFTECVCPDGYEDAIADSSSCFKLMTTDYISFDEAKDLCKNDSAQLLTNIDSDAGKNVGLFFFDRLKEVKGDNYFHYWLAMKMESGIGQSFNNYCTIGAL